MLTRLLPFAIAAALAASAQAAQKELSAVPAAGVLAEAKGVELETPVVKAEPVEAAQKGGIRFGRGPWDRPGRGPWDRPGPGDRRPPWPGDDRPGQGRPGGRSAIECSATDHGWEEHWGGHVSRGWDLYSSADAACRACKQPTGPHGDCSVSCAEPQFACVYEFQPDGGPAQPGSWGEPREDSYRAEEAAMDRCRRDNWGRQGRCRVSKCERQDRVLLRNRCR